MNELLAGIGHRISSARKSKKMTQEALAELADVSYQTISSAELGKKALRPENIIKISQALQVSTDYLLTGNRNTNDYITLVQLAHITGHMRIIFNLLEVALKVTVIHRIKTNQCGKQTPVCFGDLVAY